MVEVAVVEAVVLVVVEVVVIEAAHAVVGEVLHPGSIGIVTVRGSQGVIGGMANGCATYAQNEEEFLDEVTKTLAGRAGVSLIYGVMDIQASADIEQADRLHNQIYPVSTRMVAYTLYR